MAEMKDEHKTTVVVLASIMTLSLLANAYMGYMMWKANQPAASTSTTSTTKTS
jgi:hypothetical protein